MKLSVHANLTNLTFLGFFHWVRLPTNELLQQTSKKSQPNIHSAPWQKVLIAPAHVTPKRKQTWFSPKANVADIFRRNHWLMYHAYELMTDVFTQFTKFPVKPSWGKSRSLLRATQQQRLSPARMPQLTPALGPDPSLKLPGAGIQAGKSTIQIVKKILLHSRVRTHTINLLKTGQKLLAFPPTRFNGVQLEPPSTYRITLQGPTEHWQPKYACGGSHVVCL